MERLVLRCLVVATLAGCAFAVVVGLLAGDEGMVTGALAAAAGGLVAAPFVARQWRH